MRKWILAALLCGFALLPSGVMAQNNCGFGVTPACPNTQNITTSGAGGAITVNGNGGLALSFTYKVTGVTPSSIVVTGCGDLACTIVSSALDTYSGSSSTTRQFTITAPYYKYIVTATFTGSGSIAVTSIQTTAALAPGGGGGSISLTATLPLVVTPSPITGTGVVSCPTCSPVFTDNAAVTCSGTTCTALAATPTANSTHLYRNGVRQAPTIDYTIAGAVITLTATASTDAFLADYRTSNGGLSFIDNAVVTCSANTCTALAHTPITGSTYFYRNGIRQALSTDYTVSGAVITLVVSAGTDAFLVDYRY